MGIHSEARGKTQNSPTTPHRRAGAVMQLIGIARDVLRRKVVGRASRERTKKGPVPLHHTQVEEGYASGQIIGWVDF